MKGSYEQGNVPLNSIRCFMQDTASEEGHISIELIS
jgi:hypothetical protein